MLLNNIYYLLSAHLHSWLAEGIYINSHSGTGSNIYNILSTTSYRVPNAFWGSQIPQAHPKLKKLLL